MTAYPVTIFPLDQVPVERFGEFRLVGRRFCSIVRSLAERERHIMSQMKGLHTLGFEHHRYFHILVPDKGMQAKEENAGAEVAQRRSTVIFRDRRRTERNGEMPSPCDGTGHLSQDDHSLWTLEQGHPPHITQLACTSSC